METAEASHGYEARRRRSEWTDSVRHDVEIAALDEENGEWILCATCADHFRRTGRGRKPNDPRGFKVKMNGRFQEAAWVMHKNRVVAHRLVSGDTSSQKRRRPTSSGDQPDDDLDQNAQTATSGDSEDATDHLHPGPVLLVNEINPTHGFPDTAHLYHPPMHTSELTHSIQIPLSGWKCPGIVPNVFYCTNGDLVHAFAKYYVGSYRVNIVRDLRTDRVLLFSHDCENQIVPRERLHQSLACHKCHDVWVNHKSFRRILKKMDRYNQVEAILRRAWSLNADDLAALSRFKHASGANLTREGRQLKQAAIDALNHYGTPTRSNAIPYDSQLDRGFEASVQGGYNYSSVAGDMLPVEPSTSSVLVPAALAPAAPPSAAADAMGDHHDSMVAI